MSRLIGLASGRDPCSTAIYAALLTRLEQWRLPRLPPRLLVLLVWLLLLLLLVVVVVQKQREHTVAIIT